MYAPEQYIKSPLERGFRGVCFLKLAILFTKEVLSLSCPPVIPIARVKKNYWTISAGLYKN